MIDPNIQVVTKPERPLLVTILSWLIFLQGILVLLATLPAVILSGVLIASGSRLLGFSLIIMTVITGPLDIILSFGFRAMKKWALYTFTVLNILLVIAAVIGQVGAKEIVAVVFQVGVTVYLLVIRKKFV